MSRLENAKRPSAITITLDGKEVLCHSGETVATAILMAEKLRFRDDRSGQPRGMFCNMGTCSECMVWIKRSGRNAMKQRSCLVPIEQGMIISTQEPEA